jgi:uncharacterized protein YeaO (DUF488 family)
MPLLTKRIYEPTATADGHRLLVMRFWPRGVRKTAIDSWERALAPTRELLADFRNETIDWPEYARRFRQEMASQPESALALQALAEHASGEAVTLLCWCKDEQRCHRSLLRDIVSELHKDA